MRVDQTQLWMVGAVAVGGAAGSVLRYIASSTFTTPNFPWGTFFVNFTGSFLLALLFFAFLQGGGLTPEYRTLLFVGVFGGYTTFSTFSLDTVTLFSEGQALLAGFNIFLAVVVCLGGAFLGRAIGLLIGGG